MLNRILLAVLLVTAPMLSGYFAKTNLATSKYAVQVTIAERKMHVVHHVTIDTSIGYGNGFFINDNGVLKLYTAMHVVSDDDWNPLPIKVHDYLGKEVLVGPRDCYRYKDLCIFTVFNEPLRYGAELGTKINNFDRPTIRTIWNDKYDEHICNFISTTRHHTEGNYTDKIEAYRDLGYPVRPGMSGSPVFQNGKVIGLVGALDLTWDTGIMIEL